METIKCPVCGNPGISDYKKEDVICPHCGSDLKIYHTVSELSEENVSSDDSVKKYKIMSVVLPIASAIIAIGAMYLMYPNSANVNDNTTILAEKDREIIALNDSISALNAQILKFTTATTKDNYVNYVVVHNDGPWIIVKKIFGYRTDWDRVAQRIAKDNGIESLKLVHPGQILKINSNY